MTLFLIARTRSCGTSEFHGDPGHIPQGQLAGAPGEKRCHHRLVSPSQKKEKEACPNKGDRHRCTQPSWLYTAQLAGAQVPVASLKSDPIHLTVSSGLSQHTRQHASGSLPAVGHGPGQPMAAESYLNKPFKFGISWHIPLHTPPPTVLLAIR